ncbi:hypothetical protein [Methanobacterium formicicum]|uniref:Uncharacterized protein n=1 Tax=Methanobacterium formicicum (strain DSM 3637 / PP1) TaxID=1204725 RepID=K2QEP1_METFP|nr:hypothetical protein [Methanobacterium formicicum]EKF86561.1 hypothetical protein A994_03723 [Methanobacterium formicicum DSM 3637]
MVIQLIILILGYSLVSILGIAIKIFLKPYSSKIENSGIKGAGTLIGIFERILIFTFVLTNQYAAISIIFAAKSIARFRELNDRDFAEYYLLGTFTSITIALVVGVIFKLIFGNISF